MQIRQVYGFGAERMIGDFYEEEGKDCRKERGGDKEKVGE
jgi:hypothetical protein